MKGLLALLAIGMFHGAAIVTAGAEARADDLRVITYNVYKGRFVKYQNDLAKFLHQNSKLRDFDVLGVQELCGENFEKTKNHQKILKTILEAKGQTYHSVFVSNDAKDKKECGKGQAIYSRYPIIGSGSMLLPHVRQPRQLLWADLEVGQKLVRVYNVHLDSRTKWPIPFAAKGRLKQAKALIAHAKQFRDENPGAATVILGDFNSWSYVLDFGATEACVREVKKHYDSAISGFIPTYHIPWQLDWIFTDELALKDAHVVINRKLSDHYPVVADYDLPVSNP